ncbi:MULTISPECIES: lysozyme inhibitor LprI family protein [unclassified Acidocella]|uniref:lysozyme inhibitor LprI family protein n=1 Tax=unclassified Acidocella TaxID=2648610 RepID=UPI00028C3FCC|nr:MULTISPECIES: lysozyme inhibitor LprI family protein [unclassified Acidocella]EKM99580.1 hypothetical protein MXAZACID_09721 [Acidocella sp. MX-AZ02]WBO58207.1 lysozyme inhibitor LprI family protein [Acidocella sp. MX-AZ03]
MRGIILVAGLLLTGPALAQNCADTQTQTDLNICSYQAFQTADAALNASYRTLMAKLSPAGQTGLREAERDWVAYRDAQCGFETMGTQGGSIHPLVLNQCETALTQAQTRRLEAQLHCQEGDVSCGGQ